VTFISASSNGGASQFGERAVDVRPIGGEAQASALSFAAGYLAVLCLDVRVGAAGAAMPADRSRRPLISPAWRRAFVLRNNDEFV
jgi:hypothetical protein